jgi:predicted nicotinamide N-methyase
VHPPYATFITLNTKLIPVPLRPEIQLYLTEDTTDLWQKAQIAFHSADLPLPFWASAWAGGQALARYILDHPDVVAGKRVLDFASGSGLLAIAAAKAGAAHVDANDIDPFAFEAMALNADANQANLHRLSGNIVGCEPNWDVVLAGDISYERDMAACITQWLERLHTKGVHVLIGDPGRTYLPRDKLHSLARYDVPVPKSLEDCEIKATDVWCFKD